MNSQRVEFLVTKSYKRFAEFCQACQRYKYVGLCIGRPGVGKTESARHFSNWRLFEPYLERAWTEAALLPGYALSSSAVYHMAEVVSSPRRITNQLSNTMDCFDEAIEQTLDTKATKERKIADFRNHTELILIDEADRLKPDTLEQVRDIFDRRSVGLVLLGMPGLEKRISRYAQLYSRVGFVHEFKPLSQEEMLFVLEHKWRELDLSLRPDDFTDMETVATIARLTQGNFRLLQRLFTQIERLLQINQLRTVTKEIVEAAQQNLVIGLA